VVRISETKVKMAYIQEKKSTGIWGRSLPQIKDERQDSRWLIPGLETGDEKSVIEEAEETRC